MSKTQREDIAYMNHLEAQNAQLLKELEEARAESLEQARLNGMGSEREARLMARVEELEKERDWERKHRKDDLAQLAHVQARAEVAESREAGLLDALRPFAAYPGDYQFHNDPDDYVIERHSTGPVLTVGDWRRARAVAALGPENNRLSSQLREAKAALVNLRSMYVGFLDESGVLDDSTVERVPYKDEVWPKWVVQKLSAIDEVISGL